MDNRKCKEEEDYKLYICINVNDRSKKEEEIPIFRLPYKAGKDRVWLLY